MRKLIALLLTFVIAFGLIGNFDAFAEAEELYFTILHTNDEHSALVPSPLVDYHPEQDNPSLGGFARLAQAVADIRTAKAEEGEPVLLLSGGDYLGGSPFAWLALNGLAPELSLMQEIGYDAVVIGNHEYDYGPEVLAQYLKAAGYPEANARTALLASNTLPPAGHPLNDVGIQKTFVQELENGIKVGYFGLIGEDAISVAPLAEPVEFADQTETAREAVAELEAQGVDVIVAITHSGEDEDVILAQEVPGIDVIVGGHSHTLLSEPIIEGETIIVQAGELLREMGYLELAYNPSTGTVRIRNQETGSPHSLPLGHHVGEHPEIGARVAEYTAHLNALIAEMSNGRFQDISETVVWSDFEVNNRPRLQESPFGNFVTDAMRLVAEEATGEQVHLAFQANGVIRGRIQPGSMPWSREQVAFFDLADLVGLGSGPDGTAGYPMVSVYFTGEELRRIFEVQVLLAELMGDTYFLQMSGGRIQYDPGRAVLLTVPFLDIPVPTTRAVSSAELYVGDGIQDSEEFVAIEKGDEALYHVVTDYYIAAFLPMVGDMLPSLELILKDKAGNPIDDLDDAIIYRDGSELKVWQAVLEFAAAQPLDDQGNPRIPEYYAATADRLIEEHLMPLWIWLIIALVLLVALIWLLVRLIRRRRRQKHLFA
ncbi:MAG: hypothetical protein FH749_14285 [Firmicutes bacterium]|nr:hypothetical protein [Bacillota bacterium]